MGRKSRSDRINEVMRINPSLNREDPRIGELLNSEDLLRRAQREAKSAPITVATANGGSKRSAEYVALDKVESTVRRLRNDLGLDRLSVKRNEQAGVKVKRHKNAHIIVAAWNNDPAKLLTNLDLIPGYAAIVSAHGITVDDVPEQARDVFADKLEEQRYLVESIRSSLPV